MKLKQNQNKTRKEQFENRAGLYGFFATTMFSLVIGLLYIFLNIKGEVFFLGATTPLHIFVLVPNVIGYTTYQFYSYYISRKKVILISAIFSFMIAVLMIYFIFA